MTTKKFRVLVFFCLIGSVGGLSAAGIPDSVTIQGRLSPATSIPGVIADILRDGTTVQTLTVDLIPDSNGIFATALTGIDPAIFAPVGTYSVNLSSPTGEALAAIPLRSVPFAFSSNSSKVADTLGPNPTITGILTAGVAKLTDWGVYISSWQIQSYSPLSGQQLEFLLPRKEGEVKILSKLSLSGNVLHTGWGGSITDPFRSPELKWSYENTDNFFKWKILPTLERRGGIPGYWVVTNIRLDLDSSFQDPDTHITTSRPSLVTITKEGAFATAGPKSFVQQHPTDANKEIYYFSLEGPEAGTYVRGNAQLSSGTAVILLPEDFGMVTSEIVELTAQVTPLEDCNGLYVAQRNPSQITVKELKDGNSNTKFSYFVQGIRKGFENLQIIRDKPQPIDVTLGE